MYAVEFRAKIKNGTIEIPEQYRHHLREQVRVIVLTEEEQPGEDLIKQLLSRPLQIGNFTPLTREEAHERGE